MRKPLIPLLAVLMVLGACGTVRESRLNPFNWFGRSTEAAAVAPSEVGTTADTRALVASVTALTVEATPGGAIIRAIGIPPTQGFWDGALVREASDRDDELRYRFVLAPPPVPRPAGTHLSREVTVATYASDIRLDGIRRITVVGAGNARTTTRR